MLNVPELEERWKRYNRKRKMPKWIALSAILLAAGGGLYLYHFFPLKTSVNRADATEHNRTVKTAAAAASSVSSSSEGAPTRTAVVAEHSKTSARTDTDHRSEAQKVAAARTAPPVPAPSVEKASEEKKAPRKKLLIQPSMDFMQDIEAEEDEMDYYFGETEKPTVAENTPRTPAAPAETSAETPAGHRTAAALPSISGTAHSVAATASPEKRRPAAEAGTPAAQQSRKAPKKTVSKKMLIQRESDMKDIQDVIARFKKNKNPALSLFIARRYYAIGNYQQAYNYALITNEIDSNIEDSWLIFAKSLYKLDQQEMAIKTLKTYYEESGSVKAKITIDKMQSGEFE